LKLTPVQKAQVLNAVAPPNKKLEVVTRVEKTKQKSDIRHSLYGGDFRRSRLKSRKNFLKTISLSQTPEAARVDLWKEERRNSHT